VVHQRNKGGKKKAPNENENTTHQNIWDTATIVLSGVCSYMAYNKNTEKSHINDLMLHLNS
jgi:hypothetical protein